MCAYETTVVVYMQCTYISMQMPSTFYTYQLKIYSSLVISLSHPLLAVIILECGFTHLSTVDGLLLVNA